ncbi:MAG: MtnX-like HAD-IB family phosphatase [Acidobacteria bacterium]|nr:MtnX-like HAD-IB family phosphatase [Acidobacteriota bacterium]
MQTTAPLEQPILFLDFDGTVTGRDAVDAILETYADPRWVAVEEQWRAGCIGSRACLLAQMALVEASSAELDELLDSIEVDEGFASLLDTCAAGGIPVHIVSDGFDYCIRRIISRPRLGLGSRLEGVRVFASRLEPDGRRWRADFPHPRESCVHGCATCKPSVMAMLEREGRTSVFAGDGLSDRYAAAAADLVFAKGALAAHCRERGVWHVAYEGLAEVAAYLDEALRDGGLEAPREASRVNV